MYTPFLYQETVLQKYSHGAQNSMQPESYSKIAYNESSQIFALQEIWGVHELQFVKKNEAEQSKRLIGTPRNQHCPTGADEQWDDTGLDSTLWQDGFLTFLEPTPFADKWQCE
jgi:hypothetical protein